MLSYLLSPLEFIKNANSTGEIDTIIVSFILICSRKPGFAFLCADSGWRIFLFYGVTTMINVMEYKGIYGIVEYLPGAKSFQVTAISENGSICVSADTVYDISERFAAACEEHIAKCAKNNISPYIRASGSIKDINIEPELHRKAMVACKIKRISINELIGRALEQYLAD